MLNPTAFSSNYVALSGGDVGTAPVRFAGLAAPWLKAKPKQADVKVSQTKTSTEETLKESKPDESFLSKYRWPLAGAGVSGVAASVFGFKWIPKAYPNWLKFKSKPAELSEFQQLKNLAWDYRYPLLGTGASVGGVSAVGYRWLSKSLSNAIKPGVISAPLSKYLNARQRTDTALKAIPAIAAGVNGFLGYRFATSASNKMSDLVSRFGDASG